MENDEFFGLVPISHTGMKDYCRVPMRIEDDGRYAVITGLNQARYFDETTLPRQIKSLLMMINAVPRAHIILQNNYSMSVYINLHDKKLDEIGWQAGDNHYTLVLHRNFLAQLRGE